MNVRPIHICFHNSFFEVQDKLMQASYGHVLWQSRRGMLELDLLLMPFCQDQYPYLSEHKQASYRALLTHEDNLLYAWLMGFAVPGQASLSAIVQDIRAYAQRTST